MRDCNSSEIKLLHSRDRIDELFPELLDHIERNDKEWFDKNQNRLRKFEIVLSKNRGKEQFIKEISITQHREVKIRVGGSEDSRDVWYTHNRKGYVEESIMLVSYLIKNECPHEIAIIPMPYGAVAWDLKHNFGLEIENKEAFIL